MKPVPWIALIFGNAIAKRFVSWNKMTQLPQSGSTRFAKHFRQSDRICHWIEASQPLIHHLTPLKNFRKKKPSLFSCTKIALPIKKRGPRS
jgi:hypothetical protein